MHAKSLLVFCIDNICLRTISAAKPDIKANAKPKTNGRDDNNPFYKKERSKS